MEAEIITSLELLIKTVKIMAEELRLLRESAQDDTGVDNLAASLDGLTTAVHETPEKVIAAAHDIAHSAAQKALTGC